MTYKYCYENKFNYFEDSNKKDAFFNFFKKIFISNVIREFYDKVDKYKDYQFPFENNNFIDYLMDKIIYAELDENNYGITNREGFGIFINRLKGDKSYGLGYGLQIVKISHEVIMHFLGSLINSNDGIYASTLTPNNSFIDVEDNIKVNDLSGSSDKFEKLLFGSKVSKIYFGGNHFLFNINNWQLTLNNFQKGFQENNKVKNAKDLKNELLSLINIDNDVKTLLESIIYRGITEEDSSQSIVARKGRSYINSIDFVS